MAVASCIRIFAYTACDTRDNVAKSKGERNETSVCGVLAISQISEW